MRGHLFDIILASALLFVPLVNQTAAPTLFFHSVDTGSYFTKQGPACAYLGERVQDGFAVQDSRGECACQDGGWVCWPADNPIHYEDSL